MATRTKHYEAELKDLDHLLQLIESEMGPDAQLETLEYTKGGIMGLGGRRMISITATVEVNPQRFGTTSRRSIRLDENWKAPTPEPTPEEAVTKEEGTFIDMSRRRATIPTGGGIGERGLGRRQRAEPRRDAPIAKTAEAAAEVSASPVADPELTPVPEAIAPAATVTQEAVPIVIPQPVYEGAPATDDYPLDDPEGHLEELAASMSEIREAVGRLSGDAEGPSFVTETAPEPRPEPVSTAANPASARMAESLRQVFDRLIDWNIRSADALKLIDAGMTHYARGTEPTPDGLFAAAVTEMLRSLQTAPGIAVRSGQRRVVAIVGSTGTGKTSVAAKLAARYAYERDLNVALVSMDTYRIAAVDQLRTFAEVMGFPLEIAYTGEEFARLADDLRADLILVDTAGRSPLNTRQLDELQNAFALRAPDEVHIALPATVRYDDLALTLAAFKPIGATAAIVTKLDETRTLGMLHNLTRLHGPPVSFFSTGQAIPEDLHEAQPGFLSGWAESLGYGE